MQKTKFKIEINSKGSNLIDVVNMISNHNSGAVSIDIDTIASFLMATKAMYPSSNEGVEFKIEGDTVHISDDGEESYYCSVSLCEMFELVN